MKVAEVCGCFPTGRHYPGIAHLIRLRVVGLAAEFSAEENWNDALVAFVDTETTGRNPESDRIVEVGVVLGRAGQILDRRSWLIQPGMHIPEESSSVHGITDGDVQNAPKFSDVIGEIASALSGAIPAAYNAVFDKAFLQAELARGGVPLDSSPPALRKDVEFIDPLVFARDLYKDEQSRALSDMAQRLGIELTRAHRATDDAEAALKVLYALGKDPRVPKTYGALIQEQRRLGRLHDEARRFWRKA